MKMWKVTCFNRTNPRGGEKIALFFREWEAKEYIRLIPAQDELTDDRLDHTIEEVEPPTSFWDWNADN